MYTNGNKLLAKVNGMSTKDVITSGIKMFYIVFMTSVAPLLAYFLYQLFKKMINDV